MSASRLVTIVCDSPGCGHWDPAGTGDTARQARTHLRGAGWRLAVTGVSRVAEDYCPKHASG